MAIRYCQPLVFGLGPALSAGTIRNDTRGPRVDADGSDESNEPDVDADEDESSSKSPPGSSNTNTVYLPGNNRSHPACTFSNTACLGARRFPLTSTPSPAISAPSSSVPVTQKVLYPNTSVFKRSKSSLGTAGSSLISKISKSDSNFSRTSSEERSPLSFFARSERSARTLSSLAFSSGERSSRSRSADSDRPSTTLSSHESLSNICFTALSSKVTWIFFLVSSFVSPVGLEPFSSESTAPPFRAFSACSMASRTPGATLSVTPSLSSDDALAASRSSRLRVASAYAASSARASSSRMSSSSVEPIMESSADMVLL